MLYWRVCYDGIYRGYLDGTGQMVISEEDSCSDDFSSELIFPLSDMH